MSNDDKPCKKCKTDLADCMAGRGKGRKPKLCCTGCDHSAKGLMSALLNSGSKNSKGGCFHCGNRGRCSCATVMANMAASGSGPRPCTQICNAPDSKFGKCTRTMRGGSCPCAYC